jgi:hypothetical protein
MKRCKKCNIEKPLTAFRRNFTGCKECALEWARKTRRNPELKVRGQPRGAFVVCSNCKESKPADNYKRNQRQCRKCLKTYNDKWHRKSEYQLSDTEYQLLKIKYPGCGVCGITVEANGTELAIDHCHLSGQIRGRMCAIHNLAAGGIGDTLADVERLAAYLRRAYGYAPKKRVIWDLRAGGYLNGYGPKQVKL